MEEARGTGPEQTEWAQDVSSRIARSYRERLKVETSRRVFLRHLGLGAGALAAGGVLAACASDGRSAAGAATASPTASGPTPANTPTATVPDGAGRTLTVSVWGGDTEAAFQEAVAPVFKELTGADVVFDTGSGGERFNKLLAQAGAPTVDVFVNSGENVFQANEQGLLVPIDESSVPNFKDTADWAKLFPFGVSYGLLAFGLASVQDLSPPMRSWNDLWREDVAGKLAMPGVGHTQMPMLLIMLAEMNGGSQDDIEPALAKLAEIDPVVLQFFWTNWAPQVESREVVGSPEFNYQVVSMQRNNLPVTFEFPEEGAIAADNTVSIVAGTENQDLAHAFLNVTLDADVQERFCARWYGSPANVNAAIAPEIEGEVPLAQEILDHVRFFDLGFIATKRAEWTERLNEEVLPSWE